MRHSLGLATVLCVAAAACNSADGPVGPIGPAPNGPPLLLVQPTANSPCTVRWAAGVNGSWFDATKWNPAGVPGASSSVCIDAAGAYTVTMDPANDAVPVDLLALSVGGSGATPILTLEGTAATVNVQQGVAIAASATLRFRNSTGGVLNAAGTVTNSGTLAAIALCANCGLQHALNADLINLGTLSVPGLLTLGKVDGAYENRGTIDFSSNGSLIIPASAGNPAFAQEAGVVTSTGNFNVLSMRAGTYTANGGELRQRNPSNPKPIVVLNGADLVLGPLTSTSVIGVLAGVATAPTITGDIPAPTTLWLGGPPGAQPGTIAFAGNPVNRGTIHPVFQIDAGGGPLTLGGPGRLTNAGSILQSRSSGSQAVFHYQIEVTNDGTVSTSDGTHIAFDTPGGSYLNNGSLMLGANSSTMELRVIGSTLTHAAQATITGGTVLVDGGRLLGTGGMLSKVRATNGGSIEPGFSAGALPVWVYNPFTTGKLKIELGGTLPGEYDQVLVSLLSGTTPGTVFLNGSTLDLVELNGFQSGLCGQAFDIIVHSMTNSTGSFGVINGLNPAPGRALRIVYQNATVGVPGSGKVRLIGYDESATVCVGPNPVGATEGGAGVQYAVLLNHQPTSTVTITPQPDAQVTVSPVQLAFTAANWQLPQFFTVTAVDDALPEGPHTGRVTHAVTSTDLTYQGFVPASLAVNIIDNDVNLNPLAGDDAATTVEETPVQIAVLGNDRDPEGATLTVTGVTAASHGSAQVSPGGTAIDYSPAADYDGSDSFSYTVSDGQGGSAMATVTVTITPVNDAPIARDDQATTRPARVTDVSVLVNDSDPDGDPLLVTQVSAPAHGTAIIGAGGLSVTYQSVVGYTGSDELSYTISDGAGGTAVATLFLTVLPAATNSPPVAVADAGQLSGSTGSLRIRVLSNDFDPEGDAFKLIGVSTPSYGTASISGRSILYTIGLSSAGNDLFTYSIRDALGATATGTVTVTWPPPAPPPPPAPMSGTSAMTRRIDFGGPPYCHYTVWFEKTVIILEPRNGGAGTITTTMTEKGLHGCTQPTLGPSQFRFSTSSVIVQGSQVTARFAADPVNNPQGYANFVGTLSQNGRTLQGTLTFVRTDQAPDSNLNWIVAEAITLRAP